MAVERNPWAVADVVKIRSVPVTIKVVTITRTNEQVRQEVDVQVDRVRWSVAIVVGQVNRLGKVNGSKAGSATLKFVVPVAGLVNASVGSPNISRWNPDPVFNNRLPVTGVPSVVPLLVLPISWNVKVIFARSSR